MRGHFTIADSDPFELTCRKCGEDLVKTVGEMKHDLNIRCSVCGLNHWFRAEELAGMIQEIEDARNNFLGHVRPGEKRH